MVQIAVSVLFAAAFASSVLAQDFAPSTVDEILARDVASLSGAEQDLFSRAAVKVMNELFSREDLSEMVGREVDELSQRDLEELLEREVDLSESTMDIAARELTSYIDDVELAARADKEEGAPAPAPAPAGAPAGQTPPPQESKPKHTVWGRFCSWFRGIFMGGNKPKNGDKTKAKAKAAPEAKKPADKKPAAAAEKAEAPAKEEGAEKPEGAAPEGEGAAPPAEEARELLEEPFERSFGLEEDLEEFAARFYEDFDDVFEREPEFEDDMFEREPEFEADYYERDFADVWDDELLTRAFDVLEQLDQLD